jgi:hypothetical protein
MQGLPHASAITIFYRCTSVGQAVKNSGLGEGGQIKKNGGKARAGKGRPGAGRGQGGAFESAGRETCNVGSQKASGNQVCSCPVAYPRMEEQQYQDAHFEQDPYQYFGSKDY